jgi:transcriptional regulator with XRE-family HTH domain
MKGAVKMLDLKAQRESLKLTLEDVGNYVGVGKSTVRKWENGMINNMGRDKILKYAKILQISPLALIGEVETEAPTWASKDDVIVFDEALKRNSVVMSYNGVELSEEDKMQLDGMIRAMLWERIKKGKEE